MDILNELSEVPEPWTPWDSDEWILFEIDCGNVPGLEEF